MRKVNFLLSVLAIGIALTLFTVSDISAQDPEVVQLRKEVAELKNDIKEILEFQKRLCDALRKESIIIFATVPKTDDEKVIRFIQKFKGAVAKGHQAMAARNPMLHQRADELRQSAEKGLQKLSPEIVIPALKAELESATDDYVMCSSMMMVLGLIGKQSVLPYIQGIAEDKKRPGFVRRIAAEALISIDKEKAIDILLPVAGDFEAKDFPERFYVIYMLSETKDPRVESLLLKGCKVDPDKSARCHHINGLAHYKTAAARAALEWVIANDDYEHARTNALSSLHRMLGDEASYLLMKQYSQEAMMKDGKTPDYRVRNAAYQNMNRIKMNLEKAGKPIPGEAPKKEEKKQ